MAKQEYRISEFRDAICTIKFILNDFSGHVGYERTRCDLRMRFMEPIQNLQAMMPTLQGRYANDLVDANDYIRYAVDAIAVNEDKQIRAFIEGERNNIFNPITREHFK